MDETIWNILHDGEIESVSRTDSGDQQLTVNIEYLCKHLPTDANHICLTLRECEKFEYQPYEGPVVTEPEAIAKLGLQILTAGFENNHMRVECADGGYGGYLRLTYANANVKTDEGQELTVTEMQVAARDYWTQWQQKHALGG